ncbi:sigma-70 family RNA polymerase sigma factor [Streptomyces sp. SID14478]|nr:sigma-70 family RNA polymerase sigma factor [Streptomyces sp. SID14478]
MTGAMAGAVAAAAASAVAAERAGMVASLIRLTGDWELAEDCVQDAVEKALRHWPEAGLPRSPAAWLTTAARNRALDILRRRRTEWAKLSERALLDEAAHSETDRDDRLSLIFTCCHPALPLDGRVALTLKTVAGLNTAQIADAFLVSESTMSQRLLRTKRKISNAAIPYRVPPDELLAERTDGVLAVLYLVFNAGYGQPEDRLADEALRLVRLLADLMPAADEARSLLALILFQRARRATRFDAAGDLVPMEEQDRARWDPVLAAEAHRELRRAAHSGRPPGPYWLQARIAACHASAPSAQATPWHAIVPLYDALLAAQPSPVAALNRAVAVGFRDGFATGLSALDALDTGVLAGYHLLPAARADFLRRLGRTDAARAAYQDALRLVAEGGPEARFLRRQLAALPPSHGVVRPC